MQQRAIIGSAWGDCGKGNLVDYYSTPKSTVIRYNGGAQAGHTVVRDGKRHVFHHFGSGSFVGASTYLSRFFISNPILYFRELETLNQLNINPTVAADPDGLVTTPYDMIINQIIEQKRGNARHGSCGIGINETIKRDEAGFHLTVGDLSNLPKLRDMLNNIRDKWVPERLKQLDIENWNSDREQMNSITERYLEQCLQYHDHIIVRPLELTDDMIFEGAQGLLLDEDHHFFPYVTHSHTGLKNVMALATEIGIPALDVVYVTRAYATRHGAGPFPREVPDLRYEDETNVPNDWQGSLRFGHLDLDLMATTILNDLAKATISVRHGLAITCLDQVGERVSFWQDGFQNTDVQEFTRRAFNAVGDDFPLFGGEFGLTSYGPSASHVKELSFRRKARSIDRS